MSLPASNVAGLQLIKKRRMGIAHMLILTGLIFILYPPLTFGVFNTKGSCVLQLVKLLVFGKLFTVFGWAENVLPLAKKEGWRVIDVGCQRAAYLIGII